MQQKYYLIIERWIDDNLTELSEDGIGVGFIQALQQEPNLTWNSWRKPEHDWSLAKDSILGFSKNSLLSNETW